MGYFSFNLVPRMTCWSQTHFHLCTHNKTSWMHLQSKHWHLIDYVITRRRDLQDVKVTKAMCGAECWTDHRLILTKLNVKIQPPCQPRARGSLRGSISPSCNLLQSITIWRSQAEAPWAKDVHNRCWVKLACIFTPLLYTISTITCMNTRIGSMITIMKSKSSWMINTRFIKPSKMMPHPSLRKMYTILSITRLSFTWGSYRMSGSAKRQMRSSLTLIAFTGTSFMVHWRLSLVPSHLDHPQCWAPMALLCWHTRTKSLVDGLSTSNNVLNHPSSIREEAIACLPQAVINASLADSPTVKEVRRALKALPNGKAPGSNAIPGKLYILSGPNFISKLSEL